jgi:hypothetical protein
MIYLNFFNKWLKLEGERRGGKILLIDNMKIGY